MSLIQGLLFVALVFIVLILVALPLLLAKWYQKIPQGQALVRTGRGGTQVVFENGMFVVPILHMVEVMDLSVKTIEISRLKGDGLICKDNMRADIKVVFFVRVNNEVDDIRTVAQTIGCKRASDPETLFSLFEAKFSEALKTAGKKFDFVKLYDSRKEFKAEIIGIIGSDLNGYVLDDCAIDYLEQTEIQYLSDANILDVEGIKKITELTAIQKVKANHFRREEEKTIKEQNVEAAEAMLEYDRQLAEKTERQKREIANIKAREEAEIAKINEEERLRQEMVRIKTDEELQIAEENKLRQIIVAAKNKERTEAIEIERVEKDRLLELTERERIVTLAEIEKTRAIEEQKKSIQDVIRDRIAVEKKVVEEEEKIKDTKQLAEAERKKKVAIIAAEEIGDAMIIEQEKKAEAAKLAAVIQAEKMQIDAEAKKNAAGKEAEARKINAEAKAAEEATLGLSEAKVIEAKAEAMEREGIIEANVIEKKALAEAVGIEAKAEALKKQGLAEASIIEEKGLAEAKVTEEKGLAKAKVTEQALLAEAKGVEQKALAMKQLDGVGKEHEEFKLRLEKEKAIELANIDIQAKIAESQALVLAEAFSNAKIDIVGGEMTFVDNILKAINKSRTIDRYMDNKHVADFKAALIGNGTNQDGLIAQVKEYMSKSGVATEDIKNLTLASLLMKLRGNLGDSEDRTAIDGLMEMVKSMGVGDLIADSVL